MAMWVYWLCCGRSSLSARRAWIEILAAGRKAVEKGSLSARRAWIEIEQPHSITNAVSVALRKESVDRNPGAAAGEYRGRTVALRKEGVDRNINQGKETRDFSRVALRKEGVDRNSMYHNTTPADMQSLSARRAWIEITFAPAR